MKYDIKIDDKTSRLKYFQITKKYMDRETKN